MQLSIYNNVKDVKGSQVSISNIIGGIKTGQLAKYNLVQLIADIRSQPTVEQQDELKVKTLPGVTFSGSFSTPRAAKNIQIHSGLICMDFDGIQNANQLKEQLSTDPYTYICFISPKGTGIKLVVRTLADNNTHANYWAALAAYFSDKYAIQADKSGKDVSRLCFLTHEPGIYVNDQADIYALAAAQPKHSVQAQPALTAKAQTTPTDVYDQVEHCVTQIEAAQLDITGGYAEWLNLAFALANEFGEAGRGFFHRVSMYYPKYEAEVCETKYTNAIKTGNGSITIATFFDACKQHKISLKKPKNTSKKTPKNVPKNSEITQKKIEKKAENSHRSDLPKKQGGNDAENRIAEILTITRRNDDEATEINVIQHKFYEMLVSLGYLRYDFDLDTSLYVRVQDNVLELITPVTIQDHFFKILDQLPDVLELNTGKVKKSLILEKFTKGSDTFFNTKKLTHLRSNKPFAMCKDSRHTSYMFFENGYVSCEPDGYTLYPYTALQGNIWKTQKNSTEFRPMPFTDIPPQGMFTSFLSNVCNGDTERLLSLCSLIGYLQHDFYDYKRKAVVFTDSEISDTPNGRTGKSILIDALSIVRPTVKIAGKSFSYDKPFKYQQVNPDTSILALNDLRRGFDIENLFNDITDGITVEKKNQKPFTTNAKIVIATNMTLKIEGSSAKDRVIEFEFSGHYNDSHTPQDDFGKWLFTEWDEQEWNEFYNLMAWCICYFLKNGIVTPQIINLGRRKLIDHTNEDFVNWLDDLVNNGAITPNSEQVKSELMEAFVKAYPDFDNKLKQRTFTNWLVNYINNSGHFSPHKKEHSRRSNGKDYLLFPAKNDIVNSNVDANGITQLPF